MEKNHPKVETAFGAKSSWDNGDATFSIMTLRIMTLSITMKNATLRIDYSQHLASLC